jgi:inosine/xanthosine triphosphatase
VKIIAASKNPVKINAALGGFQAMFPGVSFTVEGVSVPSGVALQPMTDAETRLGAANRAEAARALMPDADYWIGIEGGCQPDGDALTAFAWVVVQDRARIGRARSAAFYLPEETARLVRSGIELGHADEQVFGQINSKQRSGSVGLLTDDVVDRTGLYMQAVILALIPFKNPALTFV